MVVNQGRRNDFAADAIFDEGRRATRNLAISAPVGIDASVLKVGTVVWYALSPVKVIRFDCRL